jgi:hypothetical protein
MIAPVSGTTPANSAPTVAPAETAKTTDSKPKTPKPVQVDISKLAQQLASDGDSKAQEVKESGGEKASETSRAKV